MGFVTVASATSSTNGHEGSLTGRDGFRDGCQRNLLNQRSQRSGKSGAVLAAGHELGVLHALGGSVTVRVASLGERECRNGLFRRLVAAEGVLETVHESHVPAPSLG